MAAVTAMEVVSNRVPAAGSFGIPNARAVAGRLQHEARARSQPFRWGSSPTS